MELLIKSIVVEDREFVAESRKSVVEDIESRRALTLDRVKFILYRETVNSFSDLVVVACDENRDSAVEDANIFT